MTKKTCDIFIPVRLNSSRLPKKHLQQLNDKPALQHLIERLEQCKEIRNIIVCCTDDSTDDELIKFLQKLQVKFFRGNEKDIIQRFLDAANEFDTDIIIDVEGDKIYTDPDYVDKLALVLKTNDIDFIIGNDSNTEFNPSNHFVHGMIPAGFTKNALKKIFQSKTTHDTETGYLEFFIKSEIIKSKFFVIETTDFLNKIRLTLDYPEDLQLAKQIFLKLDPTFKMDDIITLFQENPELFLITEKISDEWELNYKKNRTNLKLK